MCSQREMFAYELSQRAANWKFIVKNQRGAKKYAVHREKVNRLARTHRHIHSYAHLHTQEASIIQNIRNWERLSTIAPSTDSQAQFVKIISSFGFSSSFSFCACVCVCESPFAAQCVKA